LTGGALPLAVTLATPAIFAAHCSADRATMFFHSSSYTANPIACAAANANIAIWRDEPVLDRIRTLGQRQQDQLDRLTPNANVVNVRRLGTVAAFDIQDEDGTYLSSIAPRLMAHARQNDVLLRPLGNTVYVMPPYCIDLPDISRVYNAVLDFLAA
jgi:adenosylmethionine-8-amino-7-oxononanoate aminotransferase